MTQRGSSSGAPSRAEATLGVEQRLATTVHAYPALRLIPVPAQFLRVPGTTTLPPPTGFFGALSGSQRVLRGGRLPDLGGAAADEVYDTVRDLWEHAGCRVEDIAGLDGRQLIVHDPAGYLITLIRHHGGDPILTVASPPAQPQLVDRGLLAGLLSGLGIGCLGPCLFSVGPMTAFPSLAGLNAPFWGWVPLFLLISGLSLWRPETRKFGAGLLLAGALVGFTVAGVFG